MIEIKKLKFCYNSSESLFKELDLQLSAGHIYGLLGKNGVGKTTLLKLICGLLFPQKGECRVSGLVAGQRRVRFLQEIYFIPEEFHLPSITIDAYLKLYSPFYHKFDKDVFGKIFRAFGLSSSKKLTELSYGSKKKFLVAFGLATNCDLLVLDEPTNGLDIPGKTQFRKILASMLTENKIFIIATHQVRDMENLIDSLVILDEGRVVFNQSMDTILRKFACKRDSELKPDDKVIHSEKILGGNINIVQNSSEFETGIDIELLFNAVMGNMAEISKVCSDGGRSHER